MPPFHEDAVNFLMRILPPIAIALPGKIDRAYPASMLEIFLSFLPLFLVGTAVASASIPASSFAYYPEIAHYYFETVVNFVVTNFAWFP